MRLRGFSLMTNILDDYTKDLDIISVVGILRNLLVSRQSLPVVILQALECMLAWPLLHKNKVEDSKVSVPVTSYALSDNEVIKALAQKVCHLHAIRTVYLNHRYSFWIIGKPWRLLTVYQKG